MFVQIQEENPHKEMISRVWPAYPEVSLFQGTDKLLDFMEHNMCVEYGSLIEFLWESTQYGSIERRKFNQMWRKLLSTGNQARVPVRDGSPLFSSKDHYGLFLDSDNPHCARLFSTPPLSDAQIPNNQVTIEI